MTKFGVCLPIFSGSSAKTSEININEIINFRLKLMAKFKLDPQNFIYLRGAQEEMWSKLLELQISPNPKEVISWMFAHGVDKTLLSYQIDYKEAFDICDSGSVLISKWTSRIKNTISNFEGSDEKMQIVLIYF